MDRLNSELAILLRPKRRVHSKIPTHKQVWVLEIENTHILRIRDHILGSSYISGSCDGDGSHVKGCFPPYLLFTEANAAISQALPSEFFKYVTRHFYTPFSCFEIDWLVIRVLEFIRIQKHNFSKCIYKIVASPKELEAVLSDVLFQNSNDTMKLQASAIGYSHLIQVVFSKDESIFRWGISTQEFAMEQLLTTESLATALDFSRSKSHLQINEN